MFSKRNLKIVTCSALALSLMLGSAGCGKSAAKESVSPAKASAQPAATEKPAWKPDKPVTAVVMAAAGGSTDLLARAVEKVWSKYCPQPLQVVNKSGGGGVEGATFVARSKPDGSTTEIGYGSGQDLSMPFLQKVEYDPFKDLDAIVRLSIHAVCIVAPANSPYKTLKDVLDWSKKENKPVTAAVSTSAGTIDLAMRGIGKYSGAQVTPVPHAGSVQSITTVIAGTTIIGGGHPADIIGHIRTGKLLPLGIAAKIRETDPALKDIPTLREQGIPFDMWGSIKGVAVPKNTPKEIKAYYEDLFKKICEDADFKKTMAEMAQPVMYENEEAFLKSFKQAYDDTGKLIEELGLKAKQ